MSAFDPKIHYDALAAAHAAREARDPAWLVALRANGRARFAALGIPAANDEAWRHTALKPVEAAAYSPAPSGEALTVADSNLLEAARYRDFPGCELVFVDGHYDAGRSRFTPLPAGAAVMSLREAIAKGQPGVEALGSVATPESAGPFAALNTALLTDGVYIQLPAGARLEAPVHLIFLASGSARSLSVPRVLALAGAGSELTLVETYIGHPGGESFTCAVSEFALADNATVRHYIDNRESDAALHIATVRARQARDSQFFTHSLALGGKLTRNDIAIEQAGPGTHTGLNGLYLARGRQHVDHHTVMDHAVHHGTSDEFYKGILDDGATAVFNGRVIVRHGAQKTDARQQNRNLLLSKQATVNTTPQLEILADDVKCSHGATIGQLDEKQLFYLRSRGIGAAAARDLLTYAFAGEIIDKITVAPLRARLDELLLSRLPIDLRLAHEPAQP